MRMCSTCKYEELSTFQEPCDSCCWERSGYEPKNEEASGEMRLGMACKIFNNIDESDASEVEKALAIYIVMNMETHNSITKASMLKVIKWLWNQHYEMEGISE